MNCGVLFFPSLKPFQTPFMALNSNSEMRHRGVVLVRFQNVHDPRKLMVTVCNNGAGLDDDNYRSFLTPFSGMKLDRKGRGFGRFIAFKVFDRIMYSSRHLVEGAKIDRTFRFNIYDEREIIYFDGEPDFDGTGVCVDFDELKDEWFDISKEFTGFSVADEIAHHFFPEFLRGELPQITLAFDEERIDLVSRFSSVFQPHGSGTISVIIDEQPEDLTYSLSRVPKSRRFNQNSLLFTAAGRVVGKPRDLAQKLGRPFFVDSSDNKYIIIAAVSGDALEKRLNDSRTSLDLAPKAIEDIVSAIASEVEAKEGDQVGIIKAAQRQELANALVENPILRTGLRGATLEEYVKSKPNSWGADQFVSDLALRRYRIE